MRPASSPPTRSHAIAWTISLLIALPLIYLFSVPPIKFTNHRLRGPGGGQASWIKTYEEPYLWLMGNSPLSSPLRVYTEWWYHRMFGSPMNRF